MTTESKMFCTFEAAGRLFGVPLIDIKEITTETSCTPIPHAPDCVQGYVNIRGQIILGIDLKKVLRLSSVATVTRRLVIFKQTIGPAFGLLVDEVGEIASVAPEDITIQNSVSGLQGPSDLIQSVCRLPHQLLVVIDPRNLLPFVEKQLHSMHI